MSRPSATIATTSLPSPCTGRSEKSITCATPAASTSSARVRICSPARHRADAFPASRAGDSGVRFRRQATATTATPRTWRPPRRHTVSEQCPRRAIQFEHRAGRIEQRDRFHRVVEHRAETLFAFEARTFRRLARADVAQLHAERRLAFDEYLRDRRFERNLFARLRQDRHISPRSPISRDGALPCAKRLRCGVDARHDTVRGNKPLQRLAEHLVGGVAEHRFGLAVEKNDVADPDRH